MKDDDDFLLYLEETLIPDLRESGHDATADDFERCVEMIRERDEKLKQDN